MPSADQLTDAQLVAQVLAGSHLRLTRLVYPKEVALILKSGS